MIDKNLLLEMQKHKKLFIVLMVFVLVNGVLLATQANLIIVFFLNKLIPPDWWRELIIYISHLKYLNLIYYRLHW